MKKSSGDHLRENNAHCADGQCASKISNAYDEIAGENAGSDQSKGHSRAGQNNDGKSRDRDGIHLVPRGVFVPNDRVRTMQYLRHFTSLPRLTFAFMYFFDYEAMVLPVSKGLHGSVEQRKGFRGVPIFSPAPAIEPPRPDRVVVASLVGVALSSVVGRAIEPTCSAVVHKAQTAVAAISGQRRARWHAFSQRRVRGARLRPNFFNHM